MHASRLCATYFKYIWIWTIQEELYMTFEQGHLWNAKEDFNAESLKSENDFLQSEINLWYQKINFR